MNFEPTEKLDEITAILKNYDYKVHTNQDEGYGYLRDGNYRVAVKSPSGAELYVALEWEFTLAFDAWHEHYSPDECEYKVMLEDLNDIMNDKCFVLSEYCNEQWRGSNLSENIISSKDEARQYIESDDDEELMAEMKANGGEVHCVSWHERHVIKFEPNEL